MLIRDTDDTWIAGPLDVMCIYHHVEDDTYHPVFYEESPFAGPIQPMDRVEVVRLRSKVHVTAGGSTFEEGLQLLAELRTQIKVDDLNVFVDAPVLWNGQIGDCMLVANWRKSGQEHAFSPVT